MVRVTVRKGADHGQIYSGHLGGGHRTAATGNYIEAIIRYLPAAAEAENPAGSRIFLMGPAASEDRFECVHTFQELHAMITAALAS